MQKSDYNKIRNLAWELLIKCGIDELPIDVVQICKLNNWHLISEQEFKKNITKEIETIFIDGKTFIVYKPYQNIQRWRFGVAHEIGHILLHEFDLTKLEIEKEANMFAARILMPTCVLKECNAISPEAIMKLCGTSYAASEHRVKRMQMLLDRKAFYLSPLERQVVSQFHDFILQNRIT